MNIKDLYIQSYIGKNGLAKKEAGILTEYVALLSSPIINGALRGYLANRNKEDNDKHYVGETAKGALAGSLGPAFAIGGIQGADRYIKKLLEELYGRHSYLLNRVTSNKDAARFRIMDPLFQFQRKYRRELNESPVNEDINRKWNELYAKEKRELKTLNDITKQRKARINTLVEKGFLNIERKANRAAKIITTAGFTLPLLYSLSPLLQKDKPKTISEKIKGLFK